MEEVKMVQLTQEQYNILKLNSDKLHALEAAGVDSWEGYDVAMDQFAKDNLEKNGVGVE